jgi:hypothetical protein
VWGNSASGGGDDIAIRQEAGSKASVDSSFNDVGVVLKDAGAAGRYNSIRKNFNLDPRFVNSAGGDYHLGAGSPAVDAGTATGAPIVDFEGDPRPQGTAPDIGADEMVPLVPNIVVTPESLDFGPVRVGVNSTPKTLTITNTGAGDLKITAIKFGGANANNFNKPTDRCSKKTLAPNASCTVSVRFKPRSPIGGKTATLVIPSNDPDESRVPVPLSGTGIP